MAALFGKEPNPRRSCRGRVEGTADEREDAEATWSHIAHSPNSSIAKRSGCWTTAAVFLAPGGAGSVTWLIGAGLVKTA
jgi:hypothetical protein